MAKLDPHTLKRIYATKVKPQEILSLVQEMTRLHQEGEKPDFYTAVSILAERNKEASVRRRANKMFAITERMQCLAKLVEEQDVRMRGWTMNAIEEGCVFTNTAVFTATALCSIKRVNNEAKFDEDEFFDIVLRECEADGNS